MCSLEKHALMGFDEDAVQETDRMQREADAKRTAVVTGVELSDARPGQMGAVLRLPPGVTVKPGDYLMVNEPKCPRCQKNGRPGTINGREVNVCGDCIESVIWAASDGYMGKPNDLPTAQTTLEIFQDFTCGGFRFRLLFPHGNLTLKFISNITLGTNDALRRGFDTLLRASKHVDGTTGLYRVDLDRPEICHHVSILLQKMQ